MTGWPEILGTLVAGHDVNALQSRWAMGQVLDGEATPAQIAAFAVALRAKGETAAEVDDLLAVMLEHATPVTVPGPVLDVVGTGGDRSHTINVSTLSAIIVAAAGARVVKHGNRAASSQCGSADVLDELGVAIDLPATAVADCLGEAGISFCFAPVFHPAMRFAAGPRREIGVPTVFNILGPLANPARPAAALVGVSFAQLAGVMAQVLERQGVRALVVRGLDGLDEIGLDGPTAVWEATGSGVVQHQVTPEDFGVGRAPLSALRGGDAVVNARIVREVLAGQVGAVRDVAVANAAAAWASWVALSQPGAPLSERIDEGVVRVTAAIDSGEAGRLLDRWVVVSRALRR